MKVHNTLWIGLIWALLGEAYRRAYRPAVWRLGLLKLRYKKGCTQDIKAWRLLTVSRQLGLVYERTWWIETRHLIWSCLHEAQTGYRFGTDDHMLVLLAMAAHRQALNAHYPGRPVPGLPEELAASSPHSCSAGPY